MKKFFSKIRISIIQLFSYSMILLFAPACGNFLDVVPDNVLQYEDLFTSQQQAYHALANLYLLVPVDERDLMPWTMGDEFSVVIPAVDAVRQAVQGASIMRGNQSATNTLLSYWTGTNTIVTRVTIWTLIRECDNFILNVDRIPDMPVEGKAEWKAQAKFLKAYYLFMMVKMYGPVIIPATFDEDNLNADLFQHRSKVEDCFDYIINLMNEAIPYLKGKRETQFLGQIDQVGAKAIKARVLLQRASPFYNGNAEYYSSFLDHNDEHFFAQTEDREKWRLAAEAAQDALDACKQYGFDIYYFRGRPYDYDAADYQLNPDMKTLYDLRFRITERYNEEIIWGYIRATNANQLSTGTLILKPADVGGPAAAYDGSGWLQASYQVMERYYTQNGLPLDEDRNVNRNTLHEIVTTPDVNSSEYAQMRGFMQPGATTINMYLHREARFYNDLAITGGYYRSHHVRFGTEMFYGRNGGVQVAHGNYMPSSGIGIQKLVHPEMYNTNYQTRMIYAYPIIRVADLYLMKAEALNEYYGPTHPGVLESINEVRLRAGIPTVEESYTNLEWVTDEAYNKHLDKEKLREIILRERANEFAFEFAHRFWDMQRWKRSVEEFSRPLYGWNVSGTNADAFFRHQIIQGRQWSISDCLWPIDNREMIRNGRLIQNPGW